MKKAFKKMLAVLVAVLMVVTNVAMITVSADGGHTHSNECPGEGADHNKDNCTNYAKVEEEPVVAPGCCTYGYTLYECLDCGEYFASDIVAPTEEDDCTWEEKVAYVAPDCENPGTWAKHVCSVGGAEKYTDGDGAIVDPESNEAIEALKALGHDFGDLSDCHEGLVCQREGCGYTVDADKHTWEKKEDNDPAVKDITDSIIVIDKPSTIYADGEFHYECGVCGAESPVYVIHAHEHDYVANNGTPSSCTAAGVKPHYTCRVEGCEMLFELVGNDYVARTAAQLVDEIDPHTYVNAGDPNYDAYNTFIDNTCKTSGYTLRKCTVCEQWIQENQTPIDPDKHSWEEIDAAVPGNCETEGKTAVEWCTVCRIVRGGDVVPGTGKGHTTTKVDVASTCTKRGYTFEYCTNPFCTVAKTTVYVDNDAVAEDVRLLNDTFVVRDIDPDAHTLGWVITQEATCVAPGHKIWACTECEGEGTATGAYASIPVGEAENGGHIWVKDDDATCTEAEKWHCTLCESTDYSGAAPALGHTSKLLPADTDESTVYTVYPTCNENGTGVNGYTYQLCQRCGTEELNKTTIPYNTTYIYDNEEDARNQHDLEDGYKKLYKEGNCSSQGLWTLGECDHCNRTVLLTMEGTGKGHKQPATGVVNPTCTTDGSYICQNDWCENDNNVVVIPALGHDLTDVAAKDPTCTEGGWKAHTKCTRAGCNATFASSDVWTKSEDESTLTTNNFASIGDLINVLTFSLKYEQGVAVVTLGLRETTADGTYVGSINGETTAIVVADGKFASVGELGDPTLAALGHEDNENLTNTADCDEFGYRIEYCTRCDSHDMYDYVAELGHDWSEDVTYDSCTEDGYSICENGCGEKFVYEGSARGHRDADDNVIVEGCLSNNKDVEKCAVCDHIMNYDHDLYVEIEDAAPTCTQPGYDLVSCRVCDYEEIIINVDPLGHDWVKDGECADMSVEPSFTAGGTYHYCCSRCDECKDVPQDILTGVGFDMTIENAVFKDAEIVDSSIIAVNVSMKSLEIDIWGFQFDVDYDANNLTYLGYTYNNADFNIHQVNDNCDCYDHQYPDFHYVTVLGYIENTPEGEKQNVTVEGSTDIITLYFQVNADRDALAELWINSNYIDVRNADEEAVDSVGDYAATEIGVFADANGDFWVTVADVQYAYYIATGLYEDITYDSCVDVNKDGWITAADVRLLADLATGAADYEDLYAADDWTRPEGFVVPTPAA